VDLLVQIHLTKKSAIPDPTMKMIRDFLEIPVGELPDWSTPKENSFRERMRVLKNTVATAIVDLDHRFLEDLAFLNRTISDDIQKPMRLYEEYLYFDACLDLRKKGEKITAKAVHQTLLDQGIKHSPDQVRNRLKQYGFGTRFPFRE